MFFLASPFFRVIDDVVATNCIFFSPSLVDLSLRSLLSMRNHRWMSCFSFLCLSFWSADLVVTTTVRLHPIGRLLSRWLSNMPRALSSSSWQQSNPIFWFWCVWVADANLKRAKATRHEKKKRTKIEIQNQVKHVEVKKNKTKCDIPCLVALLIRFSRAWWDQRNADVSAFYFLTGGRRVLESIGTDGPVGRKKTNQQKTWW